MVLTELLIYLTAVRGHSRINVEGTNEHDLSGL